MKSRLHLFEFSDLKIKPHSLQHCYHEVLSAALANQYKQLAQHLTQTLESSDTTQILDIGGGQGRYWPNLLGQIEQISGRRATVLICDIHRKVEDHFDDRIKFHPDLNALVALANTDQGLVTFFSSFHHLKPDDAKTMLENLTGHGRSFVIVEIVQRNLFRAALMLPSTLLLLFRVPFMRPFSLWRLFWTFALPAIPLMYLWDAVVSHLRVYKGDEVAAMVDPDGQQFKQITNIRLPASVNGPAVSIFSYIGEQSKPGQNLNRVN
jgi:hypothetical protein